MINMITLKSATANGDAITKQMDEEIKKNPLPFLIKLDDNSFSFYGLVGDNKWGVTNNLCTKAELEKAIADETANKRFDSAAAYKALLDYTFGKSSAGRT